MIFLQETHKKKKSEVFSHEELFTFLNFADNGEYLVIKIVVFFCYYGALRISECCAILRRDCTLTPKGIIVSIIRKKTDKAGVGTTFVVPFISGEKVQDPIELFKDYQNRISLLNHARLFLTCDKKTQIFKNSPIGKNTMAKYPSLVAEWLKKENPKAYTGHALRATSATIYADSGASLENLKRHGGWKSTSVAEGYVRESAQQKTDVAVALTNPTTTTTTTNTSTMNPSIVFENCVISNATFYGVQL